MCEQAGIGWGKLTVAAALAARVVRRAKDFMLRVLFMCRLGNDGDINVIKCYWCSDRTLFVGCTDIWGASAGRNRIV